MNELDQGSIVLVDFSYSNQEQSKLRPALVVSNSKNNQISRDVIVMKITSKKPKFWFVPVTTEDLVVGSLDYASFVQIDAIYSLEKMIIREVIGMLTPAKMNEILNLLSDLFAMSPVE